MSAAPRPVGRTAWLVECADGPTAAGLVAAVAAAGIPGLVGVRRGARTVLVELATPAHARLAGTILAGLTPAAVPQAPGRAHVLDVVYDGPDLEVVAAELAMSVDALVAEHSTTAWRAEFCGFAPGFAYLSGWVRTVARLATPRTRVPAGAVGLAGQWSAAYPAPSPGGWRLLGRTDAPLWDVARAAPALVVPGDTVRWRPVRAHAVGAGRATAPETVTPAGGSPRPALRVQDPGTLTLVEDLGRPGLEALGVPPSGVADRSSARRANRAVGNPAGAAVLESVGRLEVVAVGDLVLAVVGPAQRVHVERVHVSRSPAPVEPCAPGAALVLRDGEALIVTVDEARRAYLAVRGGLTTPAVLGSRSADALGGVAWAPIARGAVLPVGLPVGVVGSPEPPFDDATAAVRVVLGPRADRFDDARALLRTAWVVGEDSNRVGVRLRGAPLAWADDEELTSEPMVPGAIQVPSSGHPVVLLRDHPTTGGYPVVAVVVAEDLDRVARLAPGDTVGFVAVAP